MSNFKIIAKKTLDDLFNIIEIDYSDFDVDYEDENLIIESISYDKAFIISIHEPTSQIWLSSPLSGAHHFKQDSESVTNWVSTRDKQINLYSLLKKELKSLS